MFDIVLDQYAYSSPNFMIGNDVTLLINAVLINYK
jgi:hypothetical protein